MMTFFGNSGRLLWRHGKDVERAGGVRVSGSRLLRAWRQEEGFGASSGWSGTGSTAGTRPRKSWRRRIRPLADSEREKWCITIRVLGTLETNGKNNLHRFCDSILKVTHSSVPENRGAYGSAREPADIGGPSTPPMLPRSAQDDRAGFSALALPIERWTQSEMLWTDADTCGARRVRFHPILTLLDATEERTYSFNGRAQILRN
jgi:hypothetical protein